MIKAFSGQRAFLSNFHLCPVVVEGIRWKSVEHFYQAAKAADIADKRRIWAAPTAAQAKRLGQTVRIRPDWNTVKESAMLTALRAKFVKEPLTSLLLATGDDVLVESNYWHDNFWGACTCPRCAPVEKGNRLGRMLMEIRADWIANRRLDDIYGLSV